MKNKLVIIGITLVLLTVGLSGCTDEKADLFKITGTAVLPDLDITYSNNLPAGGLQGIYLMDLSFNLLANYTSGPSYSFSVKPNKSYVLIASYGGGQAIAAVTPTITGDLVQNISINTELAEDLIQATEHATDSLEPSNLSRPLTDLLADAYKEVANLNAFYDDRNTNRSADRVADAIHALIMDKLNKGSGVFPEDLNEVTIRAYGGGLDGIRSLSDMLNNPKPPLNSVFTFTRYNSQKEVDCGMSDLENKRWDYLGNGVDPDIAAGGTSVVFTDLTSTMWNETNYVWGVYKKILYSTADPILLTPINIDCSWPSWSPDETKIAFTGRYPDENESELPNNLFVINADGSGLKQLTYYDYYNPVIGDYTGVNFPSWSPNGSEIIFNLNIITINSGGDYWINKSLEIINADGTNQRTFLDGTLASFTYLSSPSWSPDGSHIVFDGVAKGEDDYEIFLVRSNLSMNNFNLSDISYLTYNTANDSAPSWSTDGRFIIFTSNREGEIGTLPGIKDLNPIYVINSYNGEVVADLGDFTKAGFYFCPSFTATELALKAVEGVQTDDNGNVVVNPGSDPRCSDTPSEPLYQAIIPVANSMGMNFNCPSWSEPYSYGGDYHYSWSPWG
jgi:hypothetical protein